MESVQVEIFGQLYSLKAKDDPVYIRELAAYVDSKMREVQKGTGTGDPHRVAILTALTISDELYRLRQEHSALGKSVEEGVQRILDVAMQQVTDDRTK